MELRLVLCVVAVVAGQRWEWSNARNEWIDMDKEPASTNSVSNTNQGSECWHNGRWQAEGSEFEHGRFYYTCRGGRGEPAGCILQDGRRVRVYETFVSADGLYEMTCQKQAGSGDYLETRFTACVHSGGQRARPGETWTAPDRLTWYSCKQVNDWFIRAELGGCVGRSGRQIKLSEEQEDGETWYTCLASYRGGAELVPRGCIHDRRRLNIGDQFPDGEFVYYCKVEGGRAQKMCVGCQAPSGQEIYDGDRYHKDESIYQCDIRTDEFSHRLVGCVQTDSAQRYGGSIVERVIGCHWYEESGDTAWEMKCAEEGGLAIKETVGCIYKENGIERLSIPPNKFTLWYDEYLRKNVAVACEGSERGPRPRLVTFDPMDARSYIARGLTFTTPVGRKRK